MPTLQDNDAPGVFRGRIDEALLGFLQARGDELRSVSPALEQATTALGEFLVTSGKRLRPAFSYWGWRGAGGDADDPGIVIAAAALELLHGCALIHDDIMDAADIRRGRPSMHRRFARLHQAQGWLRCPDSFGTSVAILLGDLCLSWCHEMFDGCRLAVPAVTAAKSLFHLMHTEVIAGQYLDVLEQSLPDTSLERAMTVIRHKTAKYTVERPLQLGAVLAGADERLVELYSRFALPLGEAFQLRDDVLGVFGDSRRTGKPTGDDLREGKHTVLVALTALRATADQRATLATLGEPGLDDAGVRALRAVIVRTGALSSVEEMIESRVAEALQVLEDSPLAGNVRAALVDLARVATSRTA